jgi:UDP-N-acetylmuramoyl-tripeptide--D-alanyl-D-alanine ligase
MKLSISDIASRTNGRIHLPADGVVRGVYTDSRSAMENGLFVALIGENFDGHNYAAAAIAQGACALLVSRELSLPVPQIVVPDTRLALGALAQHHARGMKALRLALTGSNGKTTVKNLTASILGQCGQTIATKGNLNNEIGLPLSVLSIGPEHEFAVLEMGAGAPGDIAYLADIGQASIALVNNAMAAHLERLGNVHGVAVEKANIYAALASTGTAIINLDDGELQTFQQAAAHANIRTFSLDKPFADVFASNVQLGSSSCFTLHTKAGHIDIALPLLGAHNVRNALAAASLAIAAGASLAQVKTGLEVAEAAPGRLRISAQQGDWYLLDDSYNANPGSVAAGIDALVALGHESWLVLGNMAELGPDAAQLHVQIGRYAKAAGVTRLLSIGANAALAAEAAGAIGESFSDVAALSAQVRASLKPGVHVLVKGSRSARMELVVAAIAQPSSGAACDITTTESAQGVH